MIKKAVLRRDFFKCFVLLIPITIEPNAHFFFPSFFFSLYGSTAIWVFGRFFSFLILYTVGRTSWTGNQPVAKPLPTHRTTQTQNKGAQTSMFRVGLEPTNPVFKRTKAVHTLDRAATVFRSQCSLLLCIIRDWYNGPIKTKLLSQSSSPTKIKRSFKKYVRIVR
jgi:hypothetical protein